MLYDIVMYVFNVIIVFNACRCGCILFLITLLLFVVAPAGGCTCRRGDHSSGDGKPRVRAPAHAPVVPLAAAAHRPDDALLQPRSDRAGVTQTYRR